LSEVKILIDENKHKMIEVFKKKFKTIDSIFENSKKIQTQKWNSWKSNKYETIMSGFQASIMETLQSNGKKTKSKEKNKAMVPARRHRDVLVDFGGGV
jgi:hypothetical protein